MGNFLGELLLDKCLRITHHFYLQTSESFIFIFIFTVGIIFLWLVINDRK